jgi:hypothetical protein
MQILAKTKILAFKGADLMTDKLYCSRCGATIPDGTTRTDNDGIIKGTCPSCFRNVQFIDYYPASRNLSKKMETVLDNEAIKDLDNKQASMKEILANTPKTFPELYERLRKWLYLTDTNYIDVQLATAISVDSPDLPLWVIMLAASGDSKTTTAMGLHDPPKVQLIDQITANTLASGMKDVHDLGETLQNSSHMILISDLACFSTLKTDDKKLIWGQFRTLHDGTICKMTGNDVNKMYKNCHVSMLACGVPSFKNEQIVKDQLGTRELIYMLPTTDKENNLSKVRKAIEHRNMKAAMDKDIKEAMLGFLHTKKFNTELVTPPEIQEYIEQKIFELALYRATAQVEYYDGDIFGTVDQEVPTRVAQQFDLLYRALHSLDANYPDDKFKAIVENMVASSSVPLRREIVEYFGSETKKFEHTKFEQSAMDLSKHFNKNRKTIKIQCHILVELKVLDVDYRMETAGRGNFEQDVAYFSLAKSQKTLPTDTQQKELTDVQQEELS